MRVRLRYASNGLIALVVAVIGLVIITLTPAKAAQFHYLGGTHKDGKTHYTFAMIGAAAPGDKLRLDAALKQVSTDRWFFFQNATLSVNSIGGSIEAGIELASFIRQKGIGTYVGPGSQCVGPCALVFMAGTWLEGDGEKATVRTLNKNGILGFQAPFRLFGNQGTAPSAAGVFAQSVQQASFAITSELLKLSLDHVLPTSLLQEVLRRKTGEVLYIDTVDRAGRWKISLENQYNMKTVPRVDAPVLRQILSEHCTNQIYWSRDIANENRRDGRYDLDDGGLLFEGLNHQCSYKNGLTEFVEAELAQHSGRGHVIRWQAYPAATRLATLTEQQLSSTVTTALSLKALNPPPSQIDGPCEAGFQWIGGYSGAYFLDGTAYATYRHCETRKRVFSFNCRHGREIVKVWLFPEVFGIPAQNPISISSQTDNKPQRNWDGAIKHERGINQYIASFPRYDPIFQDMKSGAQLVLRINNTPYVIQMAGARAAVQAMEESCP